MPSNGPTFVEHALLLISDPLYLVHGRLDMAFDGLGFKHFCAESVKAAVLHIAISVTYDDIYPVRVPHNDSVRVRFAEAAEVTPCG